MIVFAGDLNVCMCENSFFFLFSPLYFKVFFNFSFFFLLFLLLVSGELHGCIRRSCSRSLLSVHSPGPSSSSSGDVSGKLSSQ